MGEERILLWKHLRGKTIKAVVSQSRPLDGEDVDINNGVRFEFTDGSSTWISVWDNNDVEAWLEEEYQRAPRAKAKTTARKSAAKKTRGAR